MKLRKTIIALTILSVTITSQCFAVVTTSTAAISGAVAASIAASNAARVNAEFHQVNSNNQQINNLQQPSVIEGVIIVDANWNKIYKGYNYNVVNVDGMNGQKLGLTDYFYSVRPHQIDNIKYIVLDTHRWEWSIYYSHGNN